MASSNPTPTKGAGLSLYANLLDPAGADASPASISRAPVIFRSPATTSTAEEAAAKKAALETCTSSESC